MSSSSTRHPAASSSVSGAAAGTGGQSYFEQQREILLREIDVSFGHVLANINKLNRNLEGVIDVGNEFSSVEALWSQFENVMGKDPDSADGAEGQREGKGGAEEGDSKDETEIEEDEQARR